MQRWRQWIFLSLAITQQCAYERLNYLAQFRFSGESCPARGQSHLTHVQREPRWLQPIISWLKIRSMEGLFMHSGRRIRSLEPAIGPEKAVDTYRNSTGPSPARHGGFTTTKNPPPP